MTNFSRLCQQIEKTLHPKKRKSPSRSLRTSNSRYVLFCKNPRENHRYALCPRVITNKDAVSDEERTSPSKTHFFSTFCTFLWCNNTKFFCNVFENYLRTVKIVARSLENSIKFYSIKFMFMLSMNFCLSLKAQKRSCTLLLDPIHVIGLW